MVSILGGARHLLFIFHGCSIEPTSAHGVGALAHRVRFLSANLNGISPFYETMGGNASDIKSEIVQLSIVRYINKVINNAYKNLCFTKIKQVFRMKS